MVQVDCRLVQEQHFRFMNQSACYRKFLLHSLRKRSSSNILLLPESQHLEEPLDVLSPLRLGTFVQLPVKIQVVVSGQVIVETHAVRNQSDDLPDLQRIRVIAYLVIWYPAGPTVLCYQTAMPP